MNGNIEQFDELYDGIVQHSNEIDKILMSDDISKVFSSKLRLWKLFIKTIGLKIYFYYIKNQSMKNVLE